MAGGAPVDHWAELAGRYRDLAKGINPDEPSLLDDVATLGTAGANKALDWLRHYGDPRPPQQQQESKMPGPVDGLKAAAPSVDDLIRQRQMINQTVGGLGSQPPQQPQAPPPAAPPQGGPQSYGGFSFSSHMPDIEGLVKALRGGGYTGSNTQDIELPAEQDSIENLIKRAQAIPVGQ